MATTLIIPLAIAWLLLAIFALVPYLTGWSQLARVWPAKRMRSQPRTLAWEAEVDWTWNYQRSFVVRFLPEGIHCQPIFLFFPFYFHSPLLIPWAAVTETTTTNSWLFGEMIEIQAQAATTSFRISYPASFGFPANLPSRSGLAT